MTEDFKRNENFDTCSCDEHVFTSSKPSLWKRFVRYISCMDRVEKVPTAEEAFYRSKYGEYHCIEDRVKLHQRIIREKIRLKMYQSTKGCTDFSSYYVVCDLADDMREYVDAVFEPFKSDGYNIISLSDKVKELKGELVYLVSWKMDGI